MEHKIVWTISREMNFVAHMTHLAMFPGSEYSRQYIQLHDPANLQLLGEHHLFLHAHGPITKATQKYYSAMQLIVSGLYTNGGPADVYYQRLLAQDLPGYDLDEYKSTVKRILQALAAEYSAFVTDVWPQEEGKLRSTIQQLQRQAEDRRIEDHLSDLMLFPHDQHQAVTVIPACCDLGTLSAMSSAHCTMIVYHQDVQASFNEAVFSYVIAQFGTALRPRIMHESERASWMGVILYYTFQLVQAYPVKPYDTDLALAEQLEQQQGILGVKELYRQVLASHSEDQA